MANLSKKVLGAISGAVGDLVFRQKNGKNFIATRPASFVPGKDEASVNRRNKFRFTTKLSSQINEIPELYQVWDDYSTIAPFSNMVKSNYPFVDPDGEPGDFRLVPHKGFNTRTAAISLSDQELQVEINPIGSNCGIDLFDELTVKLISIIYLHNPVSEFMTGYEFLPLMSEELPLQIDEPLLFSVPLMNQDSGIYNLYQDHEAYLVLVTLDEDGNVIHFSNTIRNI
jgi:hypothetical protein